MCVCYGCPEIGWGRDRVSLILLTAPEKKIRIKYTVKEKKITQLLVFNCERP